MTEIYTDAQATDEAVLMLTRKLARLHPEIYRDLISQIPAASRDALHLAGMRAETLRHADRQAGVTRRTLTIAEMAEMAETDDDA